MRKIQVITQKEMVDQSRLKDCTAVVIDVFLATSTIAFLLENNYEPIYAMEDVESAHTLAANQTASYLLLGEAKGEAVKGFLYPDPTLLEYSEDRKSAIICSTNGTRAIEKAKGAKTLYISSILNGHLVAESIHEQDDGSSILLICSGNDNRFSLEDFVGAGQIVDQLMRKGNYVLSDASKVARETYMQSFASDFQNLLDSETACLLRNVGSAESMNFVIQNHEKINVLPVFVDNQIIDVYARKQIDVK